jgi:hypothetical protein
LKEFLLFNSTSVGTIPHDFGNSMLTTGWSPANWAVITHHLAADELDWDQAARKEVIMEVPLSRSPTNYHRPLVGSRQWTPNYSRPHLSAQRRNCMAIIGFFFMRTSFVS